MVNKPNGKYRYKQVFIDNYRLDINIFICILLSWKILLLTNQIIAIVFDEQEEEEKTRQKLSQQANRYTNIFDVVPLSYSQMVNEITNSFVHLVIRCLLTNTYTYCLLTWHFVAWQCTTNALLPLVHCRLPLSHSFTMVISRNGIFMKETHSIPVRQLVPQ